MIKNLFGTPLYIEKVQGYQKCLDKMKPVLDDLFYQHDGLIPPWISTGWTRSTFPRYSHMNPLGKKLHTHPYMAEIMEEIQHHLDTYWNMLELKSSLKPFVDVMWAQRYEEGVGDNHNHPNHLIGGGLYLLVQGEQTIYFDHPATQLYNKKLIKDIEAESLREVVYLEPGHLILWPGWMNHEIEAKKPNNWNGDATRITVPFMVNGEPK